MDYNVLYWLDDVLSCLAVLVGVGGAVFLFTQKKKNPAILALVGFLAMGLHPLLDILLYRLIAQYVSSVSYMTLDYAYVCISGPAFLIGVILIVVAFIIGFRGPKLPPPSDAGEDPSGLPPTV